MMNQAMRIVTLLQELVLAQHRLRMEQKRNCEMRRGRWSVRRS
jgi:hypothetical protein